jgi:3-oxoacyl-[acyl-carrier protein] reductase
VHPIQLEQQKRLTADRLLHPHSCGAARYDIQKRRLVVYPESITDNPELREKVTAKFAQGTLLGRAATLADVGDVAVFVASDRARTITSTEVNIFCRALVD